MCEAIVFFKKNVYNVSMENGEKKENLSLPFEKNISGFLDPEGIFHEVPFYGHEDFLKTTGMHIKTPTHQHLLRISNGVIHFSGGPNEHYFSKLTKKQLDWLEEYLQKSERMDDLSDLLFKREYYDK
jgi:hypothetical protein